MCLPGLAAPPRTRLTPPRGAGDLEQPSRPGTPNHPRGWFFERFPALLAAARRPTAEAVERALREAGFGVVRTSAPTETRREYADAHEAAADLRARTGRSILHELTDPELDDPAACIQARLPASTPIHESDH